MSDRSGPVYASLLHQTQVTASDRPGPIAARLLCQTDGDL